MGTCLGTQANVGSSAHGGGNRSAVSSPKQSRSLSGQTTRTFSFTDLKSCTSNFSPSNFVGEGGLNSVFKGYIDEKTFRPTRHGQGMMIAVKKLNLDGFQGHKEWLAEVRFLGGLRHHNLVKLIGFCAEVDHRLLVYEFMSRGSLENHLFRKGNHHQTLSWATRLKIAIGVASGLTFLHDGQRPVIYRDLKASNILLDSQFNAKLSGFGLAKDGPTGDKTHVSTRVMGALSGYVAPEYAATGHLTAKSDVYSFGVVLLEILTGFKAVDKTRPIDEQNLVDWARPYLNDQNKTLLIMDKRLEDEYLPIGAQKAAHIALCCLNTEAKSRPTMGRILESLEPLLNATDIS
ncbi:hypothetical protein GOP47_0026344 [Adiantum capillus-veneris]|nr:hypothetical protein GOP47_0026344 [Adiantum capillus-veneris]